ncbi:hypothetical protein GmHk_11G031444 [Glycine max]|nr:hypothetical protein GmHk_11G031444 [Glycine max]
MLLRPNPAHKGEAREELNERLETWRRALETHGFRLSRSKSEYMECKFNKRRRVSNSEVKIGDHIIPQVTRFKYLGSVIQDDGEIEGDVNHRIQAGWMKWRKTSGVLCDAKVPIKLKGKFYRTAVRPAILYGTECWAVKSQHENKIGVAEMKMLRWMWVGFSISTSGDRIGYSYDLFACNWPMDMIINAILFYLLAFW